MPGQTAPEHNKRLSKEEEKKAKLARMRHSAAHVMAGAVLKHFPQAEFAIGPAIENGFYYDMRLPRPLNEEDFEMLETAMREIIKADYPFEREVITREEARNRFHDQPFKLELLDAIPEDEEVSLYHMGFFTDLCRGPHIASTGKINPKAIKLLRTSGAYWRGDEKNPMLRRIYGTAFPDPKQLKNHLTLLEEIKKRDHRKIGQELDLFSFHEEAGSGMAYWHPKGAKSRILIENFWRDEHDKNGYEMVFTPHIGKAELWETSGHLDFYKESMFPPLEMDNNTYYAKPMNCPFHIMIYKNRSRSYRELPLRWGELGTVYRYERSGTLHGLLRVRGFTQDDAHIFCSPEQVFEEIHKVLRFSLHILRSFHFTDIQAYLAGRPEKSVGKKEDWDKAEEALRKAVEKENLPYQTDEQGGAFYGPKIDLKVKDSLGRSWQLSTIQFDFNLPERFNLRFVDADGADKRPYMVHRALLGSVERFFGILLEHHAGKLPPWLSPVQAVVLPVGKNFDDYARQTVSFLRENGIRTESSDASERLNARIRRAQLQKIPYIFIVGAQEEETGSLSLRIRTGEQKQNLSRAEALRIIREAVQNKTTL